MIGPGVTRLTSLANGLEASRFSLETLVIRGYSCTLMTAVIVRYMFYSCCGHLPVEPVAGCTGKLSVEDCSRLVVLGSSLYNWDTLVWRSWVLWSLRQKVRHGPQPGLSLTSRLVNWLELTLASLLADRQIGDTGRRQTDTCFVSTN